MFSCEAFKKLLKRQLNPSIIDRVRMLAQPKEYPIHSIWRHSLATFLLACCCTLYVLRVQPTFPRFLIYLSSFIKRKTGQVLKSLRHGKRKASENCRCQITVQYCFQLPYPAAFSFRLNSRRSRHEDGGQRKKKQSGGGWEKRVNSPSLLALTQATIYSVSG